MIEAKALPELAEQMQVDKEIFLAAIQRFNTFAREGLSGRSRTKGDLVTDVHARVLRQDGSVIEGLYAAGNNTASVMGHIYPGPGSTIAPAGVFVYPGTAHR
jgi:hypothetical protein